MRPLTFLSACTLLFALLFFGWGNLPLSAQTQALSYADLEATYYQQLADQRQTCCPEGDPEACASACQLNKEACEMVCGQDLKKTRNLIETNLAYHRSLQNSEALAVTSGPYDGQALSLAPSTDACNGSEVASGAYPPFSMIGTFCVSGQSLGLILLPKAYADGAEVSFSTLAGRRVGQSGRPMATNLGSFLAVPVQFDPGALKNGRPAEPLLMQVRLGGDQPRQLGLILEPR